MIFQRFYFHRKEAPALSGGPKLALVSTENPRPLLAVGLVPNPRHQTEEAPDDSIVLR